ncbi:hypothetical protein ACQUW5_13410 [Legionella sp. CNM-1927-20]
MHSSLGHRKQEKQLLVAIRVFLDGGYKSAILTFNKMKFIL